jgi:hypothetical protein
MVWWGGAERPAGDDGGAPPGEPATRGGGGVEGLGQGHVGEDRRQAPGQLRDQSAWER